MRPLSLLETRVLGVLVEKQATVPDSYPLSLNALTLGCNQKTAREPVLEAAEADVQAALDALKALSLVFEASGSRVTRWEHNLGRVLAVPSQSVALLAVLMLRGAQTASELRSHCERLHRFADASSVEGFLDELAGRAPEQGGPLALRLARAPGAREPRWAHLLGGPVDAADRTPAEASPAGVVELGEVAALKARLARVESELTTLRAAVARLQSELGIAGEPAASAAAG